MMAYREDFQNLTPLTGAAVEKQYFPIVPVPVHSMEIFYKLAAKPHRELLKLLILCYVQAKLVSQ